MARGTTLRGPQRDDVVFCVNGQDCRLYGSQGQQRTVALSLKLAERQLIEEIVGEPPLLLLDDVLSDLDDARRRHLFDLTAQAGSQTFLSCTNLRAFSKGVLERATIYTVTARRGGAAMRQSPRRAKSLSPASAAVASWLGSQELAQALRPHMAKVQWEGVVGPQVAGVTQVEAVRDGVLFVRVKNSVWANELALLKDDMVRRLNLALGGRVITDIHFKGGGLRRGAKPPEKAAVETPTDGELAQIVCLPKPGADRRGDSGHHGDETARALRASLLRVARLEEWKRRHGWRPCRRCGTLVSPSPRSPTQKSNFADLSARSAGRESGPRSNEEPAPIARRTIATEGLCGTGCCCGGRLGFAAGIGAKTVLWPRARPVDRAGGARPVSAGRPGRRWALAVAGSCWRAWGRARCGWRRAQSVPPTDVSRFAGQFAPLSADGHGGQ